jgi:polyhydroxybutyrate depolymerase
MTIRIFAFSVPVALAALACGSSDAGNGATNAQSTTTPEDTRPCDPSTLETGTFNMEFGGVQYGYIVHLPPSYDGTKRTPLVLNWHGYTSNAAQQQAFSVMDPVSDEDGFIVVYPNSPDNSWNAGTCCAFNAPNRDDIGFARALVDQISSQACVDSKRIYTTGMSNGAFMSYRLACEAADLFAASAPVAGKIGVPGCAPTRPVPLTAFHGTADGLVAYDTGALSADNMSVPDTVKHFADLDGCKKGPDQSYQNGTVTCQKWSECDGNVSVELCTAEGEGHCWPGQPGCPFGAATTDVDASRRIADFFKQYRLP